MDARQGHEQSAKNNDVGRLTAFSAARISAGYRKALSNFSGAPPGVKREAPDPAATGSSANIPHQAGGSKRHSTAAHLPQSVRVAREIIDEGVVVRIGWTIIQESDSCDSARFPSDHRHRPCAISMARAYAVAIGAECSL